MSPACNTILCDGRFGGMLDHQLWSLLDYILSGSLDGDGGVVRGRRGYGKILIQC